MANSFLVLVSYKTLHGTISILIQRPKLATNVGKMGAAKKKMPIIPQCPGPAQSAAAEMPEREAEKERHASHHLQASRPRDFSVRPRLDTWWSFLRSGMRRLSLLPDESLHLKILWEMLLMQVAHCRVLTGLEALQ